MSPIELAARVLAVIACVAVVGCAAVDPRVSRGPPAGRGIDAASPAPMDGDDPVPHPAGARTVDVADAVGAADTVAGHGSAPADVWARLRRGFELPTAGEDAVAAVLPDYSGDQVYFDAVADRGGPYLRHIVERVEARKLPTELVLVPVVESALRPYALSSSGAAGLWQFKAATARHYGLDLNWWYDGRRDVVASTEAALDYLEYLHDFFDGDWLLAIAAYNAGEGVVRRAVAANADRGRPTDFWYLELPRETERYVPRILAVREVIANPAGHGLDLPAVPSRRALEVVELGGQVDVALAAERAGLAVGTLYRYNPGLDRWATPPSGPHRLAVPRSRANALRAALEAQDRGLIRWRRHEVQRGETLSGIARAYDTTVPAVRRLNDIDGDLIRVGEQLIVPAASRPEEAYALSADNRSPRRHPDTTRGRQRVSVTVAAGDTLWALARSFGVSVADLAAWNDMAPDDPLRPGNELVAWVEPQYAERSGTGASVPHE